ncbi:MAG: hypothetical protein ACLPSH_12315 [Vulcanimicrobiaceae bacterium]|jgi:hypothetical protein
MIPILIVGVLLPTSATNVVRLGAFGVLIVAALGAYAVPIALTPARAIIATFIIFAIALAASLTYAETAPDDTDRLCAL